MTVETFFLLAAVWFIMGGLMFGISLTTFSRIRIEKKELREQEQTLEARERKCKEESSKFRKTT